jgi:hypothetical protein
VAGSTLAGATFIGYMVGGGRAYGYDAAVTMENFVTRSTGEVFTRQAAFNNHPLLSLVEHVVWSVTGSADEATMRLAPALFAAAAVGLLTWRVATHWGLTAGVVGGAVLAAHPMLTSERDVRGYTLAVLTVVAIGVAVFDARSPALFAVALAIGVGTHFYVAVAGACLVGVLWRRGELTRVWRLSAAFGFVAGFACYAGMVDQVGRNRGVRVFRPRFPVDAAWEALGGNVVAVVALLALIVVAARPRPSSTAVFVSAGLALGVVGPWLLAPTDLYPRFIFFAAPAVAVAASAGVRRQPRVAVLGVVAAAAMLVPSLGRWTRDDVPNRQLASAAVGRVCGVGFTIEALEWYEPGIIASSDCPTAEILLPTAIPEDTAVARDTWPALCWSVDGGELRGRTSADCP